MKRNRNDNTNEKKSNKNKLKKIVNKCFYVNSSLLDKSPDIACQNKIELMDQNYIFDDVSRSRSMSLTENEGLVYQTRKSHCVFEIRGTRPSSH